MIILMRHVQTYGYSFGENYFQMLTRPLTGTWLVLWVNILVPITGN